MTLQDRLIKDLSDMICTKVKPLSIGSDIKGYYLELNDFRRILDFLEAIEKERAADNN